MDVSAIRSSQICNLSGIKTEINGGGSVATITKRVATRSIAEVVPVHGMKSCDWKGGIASIILIFGAR